MGSQRSTLGGQTSRPASASQVGDSQQASTLQLDATRLGRIGNTKAGGSTEQYYETCGIHALVAALKFLLDEMTVLELDARNLRNPDGTLIAERGTTMPILIEHFQQLSKQDNLRLKLKDGRHITVTILYKEEPWPSCLKDNCDEVCNPELGQFLPVTEVHLNSVLTARNSVILASNAQGLGHFLAVKEVHPSSVTCENSWGTTLSNPEVPSASMAATWMYKILVTKVRIHDRLGAKELWLRAFACGSKAMVESMWGDLNGEGVVTWPDGCKYMGQLKDGKRNGTGTYSFPSGEKYVGRFSHDTKSGTGTAFYPSGDNYAGEWFNDQKHGAGAYTFSDGRVEVGQWKDGVKLR